MASFPWQYAAILASALVGRSCFGDTSSAEAASATKQARTRSDAQSENADQPAPQSNPMFLPAHEALLKKTKQGKIDIYFLGDSITRRWQGTDYPEHKKNWDRNFFGWNAANFGWGGDTNQNVLWRLKNGELDNVNPKVVVLMIGTNNVGNLPPGADQAASVEDIANGIKVIIDTIRQKATNSKIVLMGITPRSDKGAVAMQAIDKINARISKLADGQSIIYLNINDKLADSSGKLHEGVTEDGLHLSIKGYQIWADALKPIFTKHLGPPAKTDKAPPATGIPPTTSAN